MYQWRDADRASPLSQQQQDHEPRVYEGQPFVESAETEQPEVSAAAGMAQRDAHSRHRRMLGARSN